MAELGPPPGFDPRSVAPPALGDGPWPIGAIAPDVAGACNLACRYCAEAATQPRRKAMAPHTLDAAWGLLCSEGGPRPGATIRLGSGEPLLALPLLRRIASLADRAKEPPDVFLTTNATLASPRVRQWLAASRWHVKVSLDGPQEIHDAWRVDASGRGTFARAAEAAADLAPRIGDRLSATAVLCRGSDPASVFEGIAALGVRRIELVPAAHRDAAVRPDAADVARYERFVNRYARRWLDAAPQELPPALVRFETCVRRVMGYQNPRVPCGAGRTLVGVGPDGALYPCFRFVGLEDYRIGHVDGGLDASAAEAFRRSPGRPFQSRTPCAECWAAALCGGPCFAVAEMFGPGGGAPVPLHCRYVLADAQAAVWLVGRLRQTDPQRLLAFLPGAPEL